MHKQDFEPMAKRATLFLLIAWLPVTVSAQFADPGFEQGGMGWTMHCPELAWLSTSTAPHGGSLAMAVQASSADFPLCPSEDPEGGWIPSPRFYQTLPGVISGDVVRFKFLARLEVGSPLPSGAIITPYAVTLDGDGNMYFPTTDISLGGGNPIASWEQFPGSVTVPVLPAGHVFALGFGAHIFGGGNGVVHFDNMAALVEGSGARLNAQAWLDGAFVPSDNLMRDDLRVAGLIPAAQPTIPFGAATMPVGGETMAAGVLNITGANAIVDWITLELRFGKPDVTNTPGQGFQTHETFAVRNALIQRDGDIVDVDGTSPVLLPMKAGNCWVIIRHRNHLGVMSATPLALSATATVLDTRASGTVLFANGGAEAGPARKTAGTTRTLWAGNAWSSGDNWRDVQYTGNGNDRDKVLMDIGGTVATNTVNGYHRSDVNMDGLVKYTGTNNDRDVILQTIGGTVPTTVRYEQVP